MFAGSDDLEIWVADTLRQERVAVLERLQAVTEAHVEQHHHLVLNALMTRFCGMPASRPSPDVLWNRAPATRPAALQLPPLVSPRTARLASPASSHLGSPTRKGQAEFPLVELDAQPTSLATERPTAVLGARPTHRSRAQTGIVAAEQMAAEQMAQQTPAEVSQKLKEEHEVLMAKQSVPVQVRRLGSCVMPMADPGNALEKFVRSNAFEWLSFALILLCTLVMIVEIQYDGLNMGYELEVQYYNHPAPWLVNGPIFRVIDMVFNCLFLIELVLRIVVFRMLVFRSAWTFFDGFLVLVGWLDAFNLVQVGMNPMAFRVARLARMLRLIQVLQSIRAFETLFLLVRSVQASVGALFWSFILLWIAQIATGILLCQLLKDFIRDEEQDLEIRREVFKFFGTFFSALLTMFEITLANWMVVTRLLYTHVSEMWGAFFIVYRGCFMFAVMKVISAVFIAETTKGLSQDTSLVIQRKQREKEAYCRKLKEVFEELDASGDGWLSKEEFEPLIHDEVLRCWLATLEIDVQDLEDLFGILEDRSGQINIDEFAWGMSKLKGFAKSIDVLKLLRKVGELAQQVEDTRDTLHVAPESAEMPRGICELRAYAEEMDTKLDEVLQALAGPRSNGPVGDVTERPGIALVCCEESPTANVLADIDD